MKKKPGSNARQERLKTFKLDFYSEIDGKRYVGPFTTKKLSIQEIATMGVRKAQLNGGFYYDSENPGCGISESTDEVNSIIAHLEVALVDWPDWFQLSEIVDQDLLGAIYQEVLDHEVTFLGSQREKNKRTGGSDGAGDGDGKSDSSEADSSGGSGEVVDEEVQTALEP